MSRELLNQFRVRLREERLKENVDYALTSKGCETRILTCVHFVEHIKQVALELGVEIVEFYTYG